MVQAVINIPDKTNRVLNIVKAKYGLKDKSQAIKMVVDNYESSLLEPELRPDFVERINKAQRGKFSKYKSFKDLERDIKNA